MNSPVPTKKSTPSPAKRVALCGILSAFAVAVLYVGSLIDVLDLSCAAIAAFAVYIAVIEIGNGAAFTVWGAAGILSLLLLPNRLPALLFILLFGAYAIFKSQIERFHPAVAWAVKFSYANIMLAGLIFISTRLFGLEDEMLVLAFPIFGIANLFFLVYDIAMTSVINVYIVKIRKRLGLSNYF